MPFPQSGIELVVKNFSAFIAQMGKVNEVYERQSKVITAAQLRVQRAEVASVAAQDRIVNAIERRRRAGVQLEKALERQRQAEATLVAILGNSKATAGQKEKATRALEAASEKVAVAIFNVERATRQSEIATKRDEIATRALSMAKQDLAEKTSIVSRAMAITGSVFRGLGNVVNMVWGMLQIGISIIGSIWKAFQKLLSVVGHVAGMIKNVLVSALERVLHFFGLIIAIAGGNIIANIFRDIAQEVQRLGDDLQETLAYFQRLNIQLTALAARDIAKEALIPVGQALGEAGERAKQLREWLIGIALTKPFSMQKVGETLAMANAMGLAMSESQQITVALLEFVSAMGLTEEHMYRIIYNFGQMKQMGKVTQREFRDLAISFVPANDILLRMAERLGIATEKMKEMALQGIVPVTEFFREFINMVNEDFPDAAEKMARTWDGVITRARSFVQVVLGLEVLGPVFDRFTSMVADALDRIMTPDVIYKARLIGMSLVRAFDLLRVQISGYLLPALDKMAERFGMGEASARNFAVAIRVVGIIIGRFVEWAGRSISDFADNMDTTFTSLATKAVEWGGNIIRSLAQGMAAAAQLVVVVLRSIAALITGFLKGHSPPKLLPDLPEWGMQAMTEWLMGFTQADFSILTGIQSPLQEALSILAETGEIAKEAVGTIYRDISEAIAEAIATGTVGEDLFSQIAESAGPFGEQIAELARREVELAAATDGVRLAEERLAAAREAEEGSRVALSQEVREYNRLLREGASDEVLRARLAQVNASEEAARAATEERAAAEAGLETTEAGLEAMQEQVQLQQDLVSQLLAITRAQIVPIDIASLLAGGADLGGAPLPGEGLGEQLAAGIKAAIPTFEDLQGIFEDAMRIVEEMFALERTVVRELPSGAWYTETVKTPLGELIDAFDEATKIGEAFGELQGVLAEVQIHLEGISEAIAGVDENFYKNMEEIGLAFAELDFTPLKELIESISTPEVIRGLQGLINAAGRFGAALELVIAVGEKWRTLMLILSVKISEFVSNVTGVADEIAHFFADLPDNAQKAFDTFVDWLGRIVQKVIDFFAELIGHSIIPEGLQDIYDAIVGKMGEVKAWWDTTWDSLRQKIVDIWESPEGIVQKVSKGVTDIWSSITTKVGEIKTDWETKWTEIKDWASAIWNDPDGIVQIIGDAIEDVIEWVTGDDGLGPTLDWLRTEVLGPLASGFDSVKSAISGVVTWIGNFVSAILGGRFGDALAMLAAFIGGSPSPLALGISSATKAFEQMTSVLPRFAIAMQRNMAPVSMAIAPVAAPSTIATQTINLNVGAVNNGMDLAALDAHIRYVMRGEF